MSVKDLFVEGSAPGAIPLFAVAQAALDETLRGALEPWAQWIKAAGFNAGAGKLLLLPSKSGGLGGAVLGLGADEDPFATASLSSSLPAGTYSFALAPPAHTGDRLALAWALGAYAYRRYKADDNAKPHARLMWPQGADRDDVLRIADGLYLARDLVNAPSNAMGPLELANAAAEVANLYGAAIKIVATS